MAKSGYEGMQASPTYPPEPISAVTPVNPEVPGTQPSTD
jgi:hypothetical protein